MAARPRPNSPQADVPETHYAQARAILAMSTVDIVRGRYPDKPTASDHSEVARQLLLSLSGSHDASSITTTRARMNDYLLMAIDEGRTLERKAQDHAKQGRAVKRTLRAKFSRRLFVLLSFVWMLINVSYQLAHSAFNSSYGFRGGLRGGDD